MASKYRPKTRLLPAAFQPGFIERMDGRTDLAARLQSTFDAIVDDLGGADGLGYMRLVLVERATFLTWHLRNIEQQIATSDNDKLTGSWVQAVNSLTGLFKTLGLGLGRSIQDSISALYEVEPEPQTPIAPVKAPSAVHTAMEGEGPVNLPQTQANAVQDDVGDVKGMPND